MDINAMINARQKTEKADKYILCFIEKGKAYSIVADNIRPENIRITCTATSKGKQLSARITFGTLYRNALMNRKACECLGNIEKLQSEYRNYYEQLKGKKAPNNIGFMFEYTIFARNNQVWAPNNVPYWVDGDITINGISYQIKAEGAEYFTESSLNSAIKAGA